MIALLTLLSSAHAASPLEEAQAAEVERVRRQVADEVHLAAFDLVDELVYGWTQDPPFGSPTPVVLASVTVPVGLGTGLQALLENHIARRPRPRPHHQRAPRALPAVQRRRGALGARGHRDDAGHRRSGAAGRARRGHGPARPVRRCRGGGSWLVLRARITRLTPDLPIVWSHTLASNASTPPLLRRPAP
ncbi:MAG: hypothetical protein R3F59_27860 [Myxococcota bacterium]